MISFWSKQTNFTRFFFRFFKKIKKKTFFYIYTMDIFSFERWIFLLYYTLFNSFHHMREFKT